MARLLTPELTEIRVEPSEDVEQRKKDFYSMILTAIRKRQIAEKTEGRD